MFLAKRFFFGLSLILLFSVNFSRGEPSTNTLKTVSVIDFAFIPQADTILVGDSIRWVNNGGVPHTSTSDSGVWDSDSLHSQSFAFQFNTPGSYPYACQYHPFTMTGTIVVKPTQLHNVSIVDFAFSPQVDTITTGDSIKWTNNGLASHSSTSNTAVWDSDTLQPGQSFTRQFNTRFIFLSLQSPYVYDRNDRGKACSSSHGLYNRLCLCSTNRYDNCSRQRSLGQ